MALTDQPRPPQTLAPRPASSAPGGWAAVAPDPSIAPVRAGRTMRMLCAGGAVAVAGAASAYLFAVDPNVPTNTYPQCLLKALTGIDCPGCGGLRATHALFHGDIAGAADHNILVLVVVPLLAYVLARYVLEQFGVRLPVPRLRPWMGYVSLAFVAVFTVLRNLQGTPFGYFNSAWA